MAIDSGSSDVRWSLASCHPRLAAIVRYVPYGLFGGFGVLLVGFALAFSLLAPLSGGARLFVLLTLLVGGPVSLLYLWAMVDVGESAGEWFDRLYRTRRLDPRALAGSIVTGAAFLAGLWLVFPRAAVTIGLFGSVLGMVLSSWIDATYAVDADRRRLTVRYDRHYGDGRRVDLAEVTGVSRFDLAGYGWYRLRLANASGVLVPVPEDLRPAIDRAIEASRNAAVDAEPDTRTTRGMRMALGLVGVGFFGVAAGFAALAYRVGGPGDETALLAYPALVLGLLGAVVLWYARREAARARAVHSSSSDADSESSAR